MVTIAQLFRLLGLGLAFGLLFISGPSWSDIIKGTVKDPGVLLSHNGIAGVTLSVRDAKNVAITAGLTDARGEYSISYNRQKAGVKVIYEKAGFRPRPVERWVFDAESHQKPVYLIKEGAEDEYYKLAAATMATWGTPQLVDQMENHPHDLQDVAMAVVALPANDKARVLHHLKNTPAENVLAAIKVAETNGAITKLVKEIFLKDHFLKFSEINVATSKGEVQLRGVVKSAAAKNRADELVRQVQGVNSVKNDLHLKQMP